MLLSDLIVLFENVLLNSSFLKKKNRFPDSDKKEGLWLGFLDFRIGKGSFQLSEGMLHVGNSHIQIS